MICFHSQRCKDRMFSSGSKYHTHKSGAPANQVKPRRHRGTENLKKLRVSAPLWPYLDKQKRPDIIEALHSKTKQEKG